MDKFETWFNLNADDIYDNEVEDIARAAWKAATLAEREACADSWNRSSIKSSMRNQMKTTESVENDLHKLCLQYQTTNRASSWQIAVALLTVARYFFMELSNDSKTTQ